MRLWDQIVAAYYAGDDEELDRLMAEAERKRTGQSVEEESIWLTAGEEYVERA